MRFLLTVLLITVCASMAMAEKPDNGTFVPQLENRGVLNGVLTEDTVFNRFHGGSPYSETRYAPNCDLEMGQRDNDYGYYTWCIRVTDDQPVGLEVTTFPASDSVLAVYCEFDAANPTVGMIGYNDDSAAGGLLSFIDPAGGVILTPGVDYTVVVTSYSTGVYGEAVIVTSDNIMECTVATDPSTWGTLKSLYR